MRLGINVNCFAPFQNLAILFSLSKSRYLSRPLQSKKGQRARHQYPALSRPVSTFVLCFNLLSHLSPDPVFDGPLTC